MHTGLDDPLNRNAKFIFNKLSSELQQFFFTISDFSVAGPFSTDALILTLSYANEALQLHLAPAFNFSTHLRHGVASQIQKYKNLFTS